MKKSFMMMSLGLLMTACGGNGSKADSVEDAVDVVAEEFSLDNDNEQQTPIVQVEEQESEEDGLYNPPFKITAEYKKKEGVYYKAEHHYTYVFNILKNGRLTGTWTCETRYDPYKPNYYDVTYEQDGPNEIVGKWSTSQITMGEGFLKTYCIDRSNNSETYYLPATCDYIWMCENAWYYCENWDTSRALKITSVERL